MSHLLRALATLAFFVLLPTAVAAQSCGAEGQRPCTVFERIPSCNSGLIENPPLVRCSRPAPPPPPSCGARNQRACTILERIPSCNANLVEVSGSCRSCGAEGETPCPVTVRTPSCNNGLIEDFARGQCITPTNPADRFRADAEAEARAIAPLLVEIQRGFGGPVASAQNLDTLLALLNSNNPAEFQRRIEQQSRIQALYEVFRRYGFQTLTVSVSWGGSLGGGVHAECGIAMSTNGQSTAIPFVGTFISAGLQGGAGLDLVVSGFRSSPPQIGGTATGIGGAFDIGQGAGLVQWFDPSSGAYQGFSATVGGVGLELGGFAGEGQTYIPYNCGDW